MPRGLQLRRPWQRHRHHRSRQLRSVTNDADNVIADLVSRGFDLSRYHVIYKDTRGIWDQILVDRTGCFAGFSSINERDLPAAIARLTPD
jgi:hypothetical protein